MMDIIVFSLVGLGLLLSIIRMIVGPHLSDRIVSLDTINMMVIGLITLFALVSKNALYLDVAMIYAILAFLETIVFSRYLEGQNHANR